MMKKANLVCTVGGSNKYYQMEEIFSGGGQTSIRVIYGRVGTSGVVKVYPECLWYKIYNSKISKGYRDVTVSSEKFSLEEIFKNLDLLESRLKT